MASRADLLKQVLRAEASTIPDLLSPPSESESESEEARPDAGVPETGASGFGTITESGVIEVEGGCPPEGLPVHEGAEKIRKCPASSRLVLDDEIHDHFTGRAISSPTEPSISLADGAEGIVLSPEAEKRFISDVKEAAQVHDIGKGPTADGEDSVDDYVFDIKSATSEDLKHMHSDLNVDNKEDLNAALNAATRQIWTRGDRCEPGEEFVPILAAGKFPYKFVNRQHSEDIADRFFNAGQFHERPWEVFYLWHPDRFNCLLLIPATQFIAFLDEIQKAFPRVKIGAPEYWREIGLIFEFPAKHNCLPRYLGRCKSKEQFATMQSGAPPPAYRGPGEKRLPDPDTGTFEEFKQRFDDAVDMGKNKTKAQKAKKRAERVELQKLWGNQLKRAQCYLGLLRKTGPTFSDMRSPPVSEPIPTPGPIDPTRGAPYPSEQRIVIICVDIESYERDHNKITEIGIATLDTYDLMLAGHTIPGPEGVNWRGLIRARHFRIKEHAGLINHEFVGGCPAKFRFGKSEMIHLAEAPKKIADCFKEPYSAGINVGVDTIQQREETAGHPVPALAQPSGAVARPEAKVIILGHDVRNDIEYLNRIGYNPLNLGDRVLEIMDTISLWKTHTRDNSGQSLAGCLVEMGIAAWHLHNAGNDAMYTLQLFLGIVVREAAGKLSKPVVRSAVDDVSSDDDAPRNNPGKSTSSTNKPASSVTGEMDLEQWRRERAAGKLESELSEIMERAKLDAEAWEEAVEKDGDGGEPARKEMDEYTRMGPGGAARGRGGMMPGRRGASRGGRGTSRGFQGGRGNGRGQREDGGVPLW